MLELKAPTLLIAGGNDLPVIAINKRALAEMANSSEKRLILLPGATHLFEEPEALERVARLALEWCQEHLLSCFNPRPGARKVHPWENFASCCFARRAAGERAAAQKPGQPAM